MADLEHAGFDGRRRTQRGRREDAGRRTKDEGFYTTLHLLDTERTQDEGPQRTKVDGTKRVESVRQCSSRGFDGPQRTKDLELLCSSSVRQSAKRLASHLGF